MKREEMVGRLESSSEPWDVLIVGGGATGLGCAVDAASRGYRVLLVERGDLAGETSSRSTKIIHGGVRYLRQGNVSLVVQALRERGLLRGNAPHLVQDLPFLVPSYDWWEGPFYGVGLLLYDTLAGKYSLGTAVSFSRKSVLERIPNLESRGLRGGVTYYDDQFDDSRLAVSLAQTAADLGAAVVTYARLTGLTRQNGILSGGVVLDEESGREHTVRARAVINATGPFADSLRRMDDPDSPALVRPSRGTHLVLDRSFLGQEGSAFLVPRTEDGRVIFAIPWHHRMLVGTTDIPVEEATTEPRPQLEEIDYLLEHIRPYLARGPEREDVLSAFAGFRPLVGPAGGPTSTLSREHAVEISASGLVTVAGGKWTTYRLMAQEAVDQAAVVGRLEEVKSRTETLHVHGYHVRPEELGELAHYGTDAQGVQQVQAEAPGYADRLHPQLPYTPGEVLWAVRQEMARSLEDVLARRTRALFLDARAAVEMAPRVAELVAGELGRDSAWKERQLASFRRLAVGYRP